MSIIHHAIARFALPRAALRSITLLPALMIGGLALFSAAWAVAEEDAPEIPAFRIVAVVGEQPISSIDLMDRVKLVMGTTGLSPTPETVKRMIPQVLKQLVDEQLQAQEAKRRSLTIPEEELNAAVAEIEQNNGRASGSLQKYIERRGLPWRAFLKQTEAQLVWNKLMVSAIRPQVRISESEIDRAVTNRRYMAGKEEVNITPLVLPVDPGKEDEVRALAQKLMAEIEGGAQMESIVRQLMKLPAGAEPSFWVALDQMEPEILQALKKQKGPGLVGPIRTPRGFHIVRVNERRILTDVKVDDPTEVLVKEVLMGLDPNASPKEVQLTLEIAHQVSKNPGTCTEESVAGYSDIAASDIVVDLVRAPMSALPDYAREQIVKLKVGAVGEPFATPQGIRFFLLCERIEKPAKGVDRQKLEEAIYRDKLELEATKFMRNLRRDNFIEIRS